MKFYIFKSTYSKDEISGITVFTSSIAKAIAIANNFFIKNNFKGKPAIFTI